MVTALNFSDYVIIAALIMLFGGGLRHFFDKTNQMTAQNARKLDAIIQHLEIQLPPVSRPGALSPEVQKLADAGEKIEAIKAYRAETYADLKTANAAIEGYMAGIRSIG